ncbi:hypothetical protein GHT09_013935 [Marmota monax]|uniref:Nucleolar MIF4G domain-containing protein 1 n=1 Tax=Marmota monax TaxID=9995 RepID=A0A834UYT9_MARMO|nr:hypothetical protein GHT09_013935 [Marmota monax]
MAASVTATAASSGGGRRRVARRKRGGEGALQRLRVAVEGFVRATSGGEAEGRGAAVRSRPGGRKSRKELRREKRQLRKARRLQRTAGAAAGKQEGSAGEPAPPPAQASAPARATASAPAKAAPSPAMATAVPEAAAPAKAPARPGKASPAARKRALLAANEEEDREIRQLERCLGLSKRRKRAEGSAVPPGFARDGLDYILGVLGSGAGGLYESSGDEEEEEEEEAGAPLPESDLDSDSEPQSAEDAEDAAGPEPDSGEEPEGGAREKAGRKRVRFAEDGEERADSSGADGTPQQERLCESGEKYIPPRLRPAQETVDERRKEELERLKKHVKGLINRLSEPNMASISGQLEELYMANSRKDMNDTLTAALLGACVTASAMPSRLMMEHVLLVSILHHTVGIEVGACFLEAVVRKFDDVYRNGGEGKECDNLFTIIAHLYNFHVVQSLLIFDILKKLISTFTEKDIELILLMLKNVGFALRKDDALSLKELITDAQAKASGAGSMFQDQTRVRFMLETMLALKNNDMRKIPGYDPEPVERLRKVQRALVRSASSGSETQLRISWDGLLNAEQTGRWWIVGSAWSGTPMIDNSHHALQQKPPTGTVWRPSA